MRDILGFFGALLAGADVAARFFPFLSAGVGSLGTDTDASMVVSGAAPFVRWKNSGTGTAVTVFGIDGDGGLSEIVLSGTGLAIAQGDGLGCSAGLWRVGLTIEGGAEASVGGGTDATVVELYGINVSDAYGGRSWRRGPGGSETPLPPRGLEKGLLCLVAARGSGG